MKLVLAFTLFLPAPAAAAQDTFDYSKDGIEFKIPKDGNKNVLISEKGKFNWAKDWPDTLAEWTIEGGFNGRLYFWNNTGKISAEDYTKWRMEYWIKELPGSSEIGRRKDGDKAFLECVVKYQGKDWRYLHCAFVLGDKYYDLMQWAPNETHANNRFIAYGIVQSLKFGSAGAATPAPTDMSGLLDKPIGSSFTFNLTGSSSGGVWGTDVYTMDSNLATAAVHAGVLKPGETKVLTVTIIAGRDKYVGSTRNGVTTSDWGSWDKSFKFGK